MLIILLRNLGLSLVIFIFSSLSVSSQPKEKIRFPFQHYVEDSARVFWTWYPNPFSPSSNTNTTKILSCYEFTFYCDLSDTVLIAIQNESDSILYNWKVTSKTSPYFSPCFWIAGSQFDYNQLPENYYHSNGIDKVYIGLIVNGRKKCFKDLGIINDIYYWLKVN